MVPILFKSDSIRTATEERSVVVKDGTTGADGKDGKSSLTEVVDNHDEYSPVKSWTR